MNKKNLELVLSRLKGFLNPKPSLEQYITPSKIAASLLWEAYMHGDILNKTICDLGSGTGILSLGAGILGAKKVVGIEKDKEAVKIANENKKILKLENVVFLNKDIKDIDIKADIVIQNPPFGVQKSAESKDVIFLKKAIEIAPIVYSIHAFVTLDFIKRFCNENNLGLKILKKESLRIPAIFTFHKKPKKEVNVVILRINK